MIAFPPFFLSCPAENMALQTELQRMSAILKDKEAAEAGGEMRDRPRSQFVEYIQVKKDNHILKVFRANCRL